MIDLTLKLGKESINRLRRHSQLLSIFLMLSACLLAARDYYVGYTLQSSFDEQLEKMVSAKEVAPSSQASETLSFDVESVLKEKAHPVKLFAQATLSDKQERTLQIGKGDTIATLLSDMGVSKKDIENAVKALKKHHSLKDLKVGQTVFVRLGKDEKNASVTLDTLQIKPSLEFEVCVSRAGDRFTAEKKMVPLLRTVSRVSGEIKGSFYIAAKKLGLPVRTIKEATTAVAYAVNMQHGLKKGDPFEILYESYKDAQGNVVKSGELKYVAIIANGHMHRIYRFSTNGKTFGYYNAKGESVERGLLQTPIDPRKMRVTSHFQKGRMHPIKGFCRDHNGVDFGAPTGTQVMAAGDGVVVKAGYFGDYGKYVRIKHAGGYETAYAHLSVIEPHVRPGAPVKQREKIGKVGATGLASGPHLHYETIHQGVHKDPMKGIKSLPAMQLAGKDLEKFNKLKRDVETQIVGLPMKSQLAYKVPS